MSNYQYAIDNATSLQLTYQEITNSSISRSQTITTGTVYGIRPYTLEVTMPPVMDAADPDVRGLLAYIDKNAMVNSETINIGSTNTGLNYILAYQGNASTTAINALELSAYGRPGQANTSNQAPPVQLTPSQVVLTLSTNQSNIESNKIYFRKGDYIQLNNTTQENVLTVAEDRDDTDFYGGVGTKYLDIPLQNVYTTKTAGFPTLSTPNLLVGTDVRFTFTLINKPRYTIVPGGPNNVTLQFQDPFIFAEVLYI